MEWRYSGEAPAHAGPQCKRRLQDLEASSVQVSARPLLTSDLVHGPVPP